MKMIRLATNSTLEARRLKTGPRLTLKPNSTMLVQRALVVIVVVATPVEAILEKFDRKSFITFALTRADSSVVDDGSAGVGNEVSRSLIQVVDCVLSVFIAYSYISSLSMA